jgi:X-X-X-Leu-X-X-Gly heptad repeat protein
VIFDLIIFSFKLSKPSVNKLISNIVIPKYEELCSFFFELFFESELRLNNITEVVVINTLITSLNTYLSQIESGAKELSDGTEALKQGVAVLDSKMGELNDGINAFNSEGISKLSSYAARIKQVSNKVDALVTLSSNYDSFALKDNTTKSNTKFIMVVDSVSAPKKEVKKVETKKKETFWDRVINLFK